MSQFHIFTQHPLWVVTHTACLFSELSYKYYLLPLLVEFVVKLLAMLLSSLLAEEMLYNYCFACSHFSNGLLVKQSSESTYSSLHSVQLK